GLGLDVVGGGVGDGVGGAGDAGRVEGGGVRRGGGGLLHGAWFLSCLVGRCWVQGRCGRPIAAGWGLDAGFVEVDGALVGVVPGGVEFGGGLGAGKEVGFAGEGADAHGCVGVVALLEHASELVVEVGEGGDTRGGGFAGPCEDVVEVAVVVLAEARQEVVGDLLLHAGAFH